MANIIRIKRTSTTAITTGTLAIGELAYSSLAGTQSNTGDRIFIGTGHPMPRLHRLPLVVSILQIF